MNPLDTLLTGLQTGAIYTLFALGFTLVFGVLRRVNLAYGACAMAGVYAAIWVHLHWAVPPWLLMPVTIAATVLAGIYVERVCLAPHARRSTAVAMAATFAAWMQFDELSTLVLPGHAFAFPSPFTDTAVERGTGAGATMAAAAPLVQRVLSHRYGVVFACSALAAAAVWWLLYRTRFGLTVRATSADREAAGYAGIDVRRVYASISVVASVLGAVAAYLTVSVSSQVTPMFAMWVTLKGLVAAMLGGIGSLSGALAGGLLLGVLEAFAQDRFGPQYRDMCGYVLLFGVLWLCPDGAAGLWRRLRRERRSGVNEASVANAVNEASAVNTSNAAHTANAADAANATDSRVAQESTL
jgi:branched-chain amino acid transport system permease protein